MREMAKSKGSLVFLMVVLSLFIFQTADASSKDTIKWRFFAFTGAVHPITKYFQGFAADVKEKTKGRLEITVYPGGELPYKAFDTVKIVSQRQVELADGYGGFISGDVPFLGVYSLPFLVTTCDDVQKAVDATKDLLDEELGKRDVQILYRSYWPSQTLWSVKPLASLNDLKGRKWRGKGSEENAFFSKFGAIPMTLATAEVPTAIQRNVVDGVISAAFNIVGAGWVEMFKYALLIELYQPFDFILMNRSAFNELPEDIKKILVETALHHQKKMTVEVPVGLENEARDKLKKAGYTFYNASENEVAEAQRRMSSYWEEWAKESGGKAQEALLKVRKAVKR